MDLELRGKVVAITGGTDGLGLALADRLVESGARVAVCGRNEERLTEARTRWEGAGADALALRADVTEPKDLESFVDAIVTRWGGLDAVVNNAGKASTGAIDTVGDAAWREDLDLKVLAAVRLVRLALPHLRAAGDASIVNVLSVAAKTPGAGSLPTTASRAAGLAITKALSHELGPAGIRVNSVLVGLIESGQWRRTAEATNQPLERVYEQLAKSVPLGRVGRAEEFADLVSYLLSARASYVSGAAINLDGGMSQAL
jgi:NAD(P)-dependent dehydrogenase (short-subunit alcohol dehydrogenase family)